MTVASKECITCGCNRALTEYPLRKSSPDGRRNECRNCARAKHKLWRISNPDKVQSTCERYRSANKERIAAKESLRYRANREHINAGKKLWDKANRERKAESSRRWAATNKERRKAKARERVASNPEKHKRKQRESYQRNKERRLANTREWQRKNKESVRAITRNYRAKKTAGGRHTGSQIKELYSRQGGKCACCGSPLNDKYHADHIVPVSKGGLNGIANIQLLCPPCNLRKSDKDPIQFMQEMGYLL